MIKCSHNRGGVVMTTFFKGLLGIGSVILGGWAIAYVVNQHNNSTLDPVEVIEDFDYYEETYEEEE